MTTLAAIRTLQARLDEVGASSEPPVAEALRSLRALVARDEYRREERRDLYDVVARVIRELGSAWVRGEAPSADVGVFLVSDATSALSALAVAAGVPLEREDPAS